MKILAMATMMAAVTMACAGEVKHEITSKVMVYMVDDASVSSPLLSQARTMASEMFSRIGVRIDWRLGTCGEPQLLREHAIAVRVTVQNPQRRKPSVDAFAFTIPAEGPHITVLYNRLAWSLGKPGLAPALFAHVLVHEITHVSEGVSRHSETGIMKANWTSRDYNEMRTRTLEFAAEDIELIQQGLSRRSVKAVSSKPVRHEAQ